MENPKLQILAFIEVTQKILIEFVLWHRLCSQQLGHISDQNKWRCLTSWSLYFIKEILSMKIHLRKYLGKRNYSNNIIGIWERNDKKIEAQPMSFGIYLKEIPVKSKQITGVQQTSPTLCFTAFLSHQLLISCFPLSPVKLFVACPVTVDQDQSSQIHKLLGCLVGWTTHSLERSKTLFLFLLLRDSPSFLW